MNALDKATSNIVAEKRQEQNPYELALINGDLSRLSDNERLAYYNELCKSLKLNPLTKPFEYMRLNNKLVLYATKACSEQLRNINKVSITSMKTEVLNDIYIVQVMLKDSTGRTDIATGAVNINGLRGEALSNAFLKAETKAKRRGTLSICGLGFIDESEVESIAGAKKVDNPTDIEVEVINNVKAINKEANTPQKDLKIEFRQKLQELGLSENEFASFSTFMGITKGNAKEKINSFLNNENELKSAVEFFLKDNR